MSKGVVAALGRESAGSVVGVVAACAAAKF